MAVSLVLRRRDERVLPRRPLARDPHGSAARVASPALRGCALLPAVARLVASRPVARIARP